MILNDVKLSFHVVGKMTVVTHTRGEGRGAMVVGEEHVENRVPLFIATILNPPILLVLFLS